MHQAYNIHSILKQGVHIDSIAAYDNNVILGTHSGQLIMYSVDENYGVDMLMFSKSFSKKSVVQMAVVPEENLLFVLSDSMIHVCDISRTDNNFTFIHSAQLTKGCSMFALDVQSTTEKSVTVIRVCCAIKRTLNFFYWKLNALAFPDFTIELKDVPKALCWVDDLICVGFKDEYVIYNIKYNKTEKYDLTVTSSSHNLGPSICLLKDDILGISKDAYLVAINLEAYKNRKDDKTNVQGSLDTTGGKSKNGLKPMIWSSPLLGIVWDEPFVVGRTANGVEIRCLEKSGIDKGTLVQSIPELNKIKHLVRSSKGIIFAAATSELWCITLADVPTQRKQLLKQKKYQLAIELTNISDEPELSKTETIRHIHVRFAKELFTLKKFSAAMSEFEKGQANPYDVIRLFPNLFNERPQSTSSESFNIAVPVPPTFQLEDKDLENALLALIEFLALARQKEVVKLRDTKSTSNSLLSVIDTTLLKCYLQTNDSLIAPLLRLGQCHLEESEKTLLKHDKISELIILYQTNDKHKKALELLQCQAYKEGSSLYGYERTIRYLQQLGNSHLPLIKEFSDWVLKANPEQGLRIFTEDFIEIENLDRPKVLDFLLKDHKTLVIPYLEHIINVWHDSNTIMHNILIKQYREKIEHIMEDLAKDDSDQNEKLNMELKEYRKKLHSILQNSNYSLDVVLREFPTKILLEERAIILGRMKKHENVLSIYIQILGDVEKASQYCEDSYADEPDVFYKLIKTILDPLQQAPHEDIELHKDFKEPNIDVALELLNKYALKIDLYKVWPLLPKDLPVQRMHHYLDTVLRQKNATRTSLEIKKGLLEARVKRCTQAIKEQQNTHFEINESTICSECKKRFANQTAFVRYPNGELVHLSCHDKRVMAANLFGT